MGDSCQPIFWRRVLSEHGHGDIRSQWTEKARAATDESRGNRHGDLIKIPCGEETLDRLSSIHVDFLCLAFIQQLACLFKATYMNDSPIINRRASTEYDDVFISKGPFIEPCDGLIGFTPHKDGIDRGEESSPHLGRIGVTPP